MIEDSIESEPTKVDVLGSVVDPIRNKMSEFRGREHAEARGTVLREGTTSVYWFYNVHEQRIARHEIKPTEPSEGMKTPDVQDKVTCTITDIAYSAETGDIKEVATSEATGVRSDFEYDKLDWDDEGNDFPDPTPTTPDPLTTDLLSKYREEIERSEGFKER